MTTGVPASGAGPVADLIASDPPPRIKTAFSDLLDQALAHPRVHKTKTEVWVDHEVDEDGQVVRRAHWEVVS